MAKQMIVVTVAMLALGTSLGFVRFRQTKAEGSFGNSRQLQPEAVTTIVVRKESWPATLEAIGSVAAARGVTVSADLPGVVQTISFDSGRTVSAGEVLVQLDTRLEEAQLREAEAQRTLSRIDFTRVQQLAGEGVVSRMDFDKAQADLRQWDAKVAQIQAMIDRKIIRAPFRGVLGIRQVNLGQYLPSGTAIVSLLSMDPIYVNVSFPQQTASQVRVGQELLVTADELPGLHFRGRITAIDSVVDEATRNFQVQGTLANPGGTLRPGMFVRAKLFLQGEGRFLTVPLSAISYAPYGDSVFVVADSTMPGGRPYRSVRQQFVKLGAARGDQVAVLSGINSGDEVVSSGAFKLRNGAAIQVVNSIRPPDSPAPRVEDR